MIIIFDLTLYDTIVQGIDIITIFMNMVHLLKLHAWKVGDRVFEPHYGLQASKKQNVSSPLTREDFILRGAPVTEK